MTSSLNRTASWVVVDLKTDEAVLETFNKRLADAVNREKYKVVPILAYLQSLNRKD
jgi:hypothetical protein